LYIAGELAWWHPVGGMMIRASSSIATRGFGSITMTRTEFGLTQLF
jgi:hypothetical protein